jgi:alkanesulfonate monooxygenase SsuD/methylene tetrahydromethanopterin reductase-like flavin-dependent oxidoreductase (luciferase family)
MVAISLQIEGQSGLTWPLWKQMVAATESLGFAGLFRSDHFTDSAPPDHDSLEAIISLAYAADHTQRIHFGPLVSPLSFRHPALLARQAAGLDDLSGGRMVLGLGVGWQAREHTLFGFPLGDVSTRMARFEEGLEVVTQLLRSEEPVMFSGQFFQLEGGQVFPRPTRPGGPTLLIGGNGPKRTLPLVARYADIWNALFLTPTQFSELRSELDAQLRLVGREGKVRRTMMIGLFFGRTLPELEQYLARTRPGDVRQELDRLLERGTVLVGTPDMVVEQIKRYGEAGVEELMVQWRDLDDLERLRGFAESVLPLI